MSIKIEPMQAIGHITTNASDRTLDNMPRKEPTLAPVESAKAEGTQPPIQEAPKAPEASSQQLEASPVDPRIAELERKERLLREQARKLAAEKAAFDQGRQQQAPKPNALTAEEWKAQFMKNPEALGINRQEMADLYLTQPSEERQMVSRLEAKIAELESQIGQGSKQMEEAQAKAYDNALRQMKAETQRLVETSPQDYELVSANGAYDAVVGLIEATYKEEGILMSVKDAATRVEEHLLSKALKSADLKKVREKLLPQQAAAGQPAVQQTQAQQKTSPTLSQSMAAAKPMTPRERAIAAFNRKNI